MNIIVTDLNVNPFSRPGKHRRSTLAVILHWVGKAGQSAASVRAYFASLSAQKQEPYRFASAHYIVGLSGEILRAMPEEEVAYHCGSSAKDPESGKIYTDWARHLFGNTFTSNTLSPNYASIGIELCHPDWSGIFNDATLDAAVELVVSLCRKYSLDPLLQLGRHYDVVGWKACPKRWVERPDEWVAFRQRVIKSL